MPRAKYNFTEAAIMQLLSEVEKKTNVTISSISDCIVLSEVMKKYEVTISPHTIGRIYRLISTKSKPSKYTLDCLSSVAGFEDWECFFKKHNERIAPTPFIVNEEKCMLSEGELLLVEYCIKDNAINPLKNYLNKIEPLIESRYDERFYWLINKLGLGLRENPVAMKQLIPFLMDRKRLSDRFFAQWVDMDGLNTYYANLIEKYFIRNNHPLNPLYEENEIWAYSMLMYHALFINDIKRYKQLGFQLFKSYEPSNIILDNGKYDCYPFARYHANHIIYTYLTNNKTSGKWFEQKLTLIKGNLKFLPQKKDAINVLALIIEALFLCSKYDLIFCFYYDEYKQLAADFIQENTIKKEPIEMIKFIYYFNHTLKELEILGSHVISDSLELQYNKNVVVDSNLKNYHYFFTLNKALGEHNEKNRKLLIREARKCANYTNNLLYETLIKKKI